MVVLRSRQLHDASHVRRGHVGGQRRVVRSGQHRQALAHLGQAGSQQFGVEPADIPGEPGHVMRR